MKKVSIAEKRLIDKVVGQAAELDAEIATLPPSAGIRLLRRRLLMSQRELANRAGLPQSTVSRIESGRIDPNIKTLRQIYSALGCTVAVLPVASHPPDEMIRRQARLLAEKRLNYLKGTMALEEQTPDEALLEDLVADEEKRILDQGVTGLWGE